MTMTDTLAQRLAGLACPVGRTLLDPAVQDEPWDFYAELRERCPVFPMPEIGAVVVTRYEDIRAVLMNPELFSSSGRGGGTKSGLQVDNAIRYQQILRERGWGHVETLQRTDPPVHTAYRQLVAKAFLPRRIKEMAPHIDDVATALIDELLDRGECEFNMDFAMPLPGIIIAEELGLDRSEIARFNRWAEAMLAIATRPLSEDELLETVEIELEAQHHLAVEFERRRHQPTGDLISTLVHAHEDEDGAEPLTVAELQNLMHQLVTGGFETTSSALNHGMWLLTRMPDVQSRVRADLSLVPAFVEEVLRFESPVQGLARRATRDVELGGTTIPEGATVVIRYASANRDETVFEAADEFDLDRAKVPQHLAFGVGPHFCVGAALARQELVTSFTRWLERTSVIELARPLESPVHHPSFILFPMRELPLRFERAQKLSEKEST